MAAPAASPSPNGLSPQAHSIPACPAWQAAPAVPDALAGPDAAAVVPATEAREPLVAPPGAADREFPLPKPRLDNAAPAGAADSRGVPGRFCLWILKYLGCVWDVFSCRFQHPRCHTGITHLSASLQIVCTPSHTVLYQKMQTSVEHILVRERSSPGSFVPVENSGSIMGLVELPAERPQSQIAITPKSQIQP